MVVYNRPICNWGYHICTVLAEDVFERLYRRYFVERVKDKLSDIRSELINCRGGDTGGSHTLEQLFFGICRKERLYRGLLDTYPEYRTEEFQHKHTKMIHLGLFGCCGDAIGGYVNRIIFSVLEFKWPNVLGDVFFVREKKRETLVQGEVLFAEESVVT